MTEDRFIPILRTTARDEDERRVGGFTLLRKGKRTREDDGRARYGDRQFLLCVCGGGGLSILSLRHPSKREGKAHTALLEVAHQLILSVPQRRIAKMKGTKP
jgi:hypothetical protein